MKLIGAPLSPFVRKVRIVAAEKGIAYDFDPSIGPMTMPDSYTDIHPLRRIPALVVEEDNPRAIINDSSAICAYFEKLEPTPSVYPSDNLQFGRILWLEEFADTGFAEQVGLGVFRPMFFNIAMQKEPDIDTAQATLVKLREGHFAYLESQLGDGDWFGGDIMSVADISIGCNLINLMHVGYHLKPSDGARLSAMFERFLSCPSVDSFVQKERATLDKMGMAFPELK
ncbi:glutathione S-transferase family protein [Alphaproteobacteria bacterium]|nr:glutathione S-transferase family protein [Alphaproteobacteria bacterium]